MTKARLIELDQMHARAKKFRDYLGLAEGQKTARSKLTVLLGNLSNYVPEEVCAAAYEGCKVSLELQAEVMEKEFKEA